MNPAHLWSWFHRTAATQADIPERTASAITLSGGIVLLAIAIGLTIPALESATRWIISRGEARPVEIATATALFAAAFVSFALARRLRPRPRGALPAAFYTLFGCGMLLVGLEEIAWGQPIFHFATPDWIASWNTQDETTLHNVDGLPDSSDPLRLLFALGGLLGIALRSLPRLQSIGVPLLLLPWLLAILAASLLELYLDIHDLRSDLNLFSDRDQVIDIRELMELWAGIAALLYVWLNRRATFAPQGPPAQPPLTTPRPPAAPIPPPPLSAGDEAALLWSPA